MGIKSGLTPIRPNGSQIEIYEEKILITYCEIVDDDSKKLAEVEIKPEHLLPFVLQLFEAGNDFEEKFKKNIGFAEVAEAEDDEDEC